MACNKKGVDYVNINGTNYTVRAMGSISPSETKREAVVNLTGGADFKETGMAPSIKGLEISVDNETKVKPLVELCDANIQVGMKDGKIWMLVGASQTADGEYNPEEGTVTLDFEGKSMSEL